MTRMARVASPRKGKISAICSSKSRRRSQFTLTKEPLLVESASTSSAIPSWFKREASPRHLGSRNTQGFRAAGLLDYQTDRLSCSHGPRESARHGTDASLHGGWHAPEYSPLGGHQLRKTL